MNKWIAIIIADLFALGFILGIVADKSHAQGPTVTQSYGLTLERDDFPPSAAGDTTFSTPVPARSSFVLVYRNGLLQRPGVNCPSPPPLPAVAPCDYNVSGNVTVTYPTPGVGAGDFITILFYR